MCEKLKSNFFSHVRCVAVNNVGFCFLGFFAPITHRPTLGWRQRGEDVTGENNLPYKRGAWKKKALFNRSIELGGCVRI